MFISFRINEVLVYLYKIIFVIKYYGVAFLHFRRYTQYD